MSTDLTPEDPVGDPTASVEATVIPAPSAPFLEPEHPGDGSAPDGFHPNGLFAAIDGVGLDGVAARTLDIAILPDAALRPSDLPDTAHRPSDLPDAAHRPSDLPDTAHRPTDLPGVANQLASVARALAAEVSVGATVQRLVELATVIVPGCQHAGVAVLRRGRPETPAATDEVSGQVDRIQYEAGEGPCLSAIFERPTYRTGDLSAETRWPKFSRPAVERTGVLSVLAYRLFTEGDTVGALSLYSRQRYAFDEEAEAIGTILAAHAALAFARAREREQLAGLEQAVASNRSIGMAIGILMAIRRIGQDEAFDLLRRVSQRTNRKLREIADEVVHTGQLPGASRG